MANQLRDLVRRRAGRRCEYCQLPENVDCLPFQVDHIIAVKHGGASDAANLAWSCFDCNVRKGPNIAGLDPASRAVVPLFHPRTDPWSEHFAWSGTTLGSLSARGRATIQTLGINLPHRQELRKALGREGVWRPGDA